MKKFYIKKSDPMEETPILERLERRPTLVGADNETPDDLHAMAARTLSMASTSSGRRSSNSATWSPTIVITDSDLASSWIYTRRREAANVSRDPMNPSELQQPEVELQQVPLATRERMCTNDCCCFTGLCIVFICILGILSSIGGIIYLEVFVPHPGLHHRFANSSRHPVAIATNTTGADSGLERNSTLDLNSTVTANSTFVLFTKLEDVAGNVSAVARDSEAAGKFEAIDIEAFTVSTERFAEMVSNKRGETERKEDLEPRNENIPEVNFIKRIGKLLEMDVTGDDGVNHFQSDGDRNVAVKRVSQIKPTGSLAVAFKNIPLEHLSTDVDSTMLEKGHKFYKKLEDMNVSERNSKKLGEMSHITQDAQFQDLQKERDFGFSNKKLFESRNKRQKDKGVDLSYFTTFSTTAIPKHILDILSTTEVVKDLSRSHFAFDTEGEKLNNKTGSFNPSASSHVFEDDKEDNKSSEEMSKFPGEKRGPEGLVKVFETIYKSQSNPSGGENNLEGAHSGFNRKWLQPRLNVDRSEERILANPKSVAQERRNYLNHVRKLLFHSS